LGSTLFLIFASPLLHFLSGRLSSCPSICPHKSIRNVEHGAPAAQPPTNYNLEPWYFSSFSLWSFAHFTWLHVL